MALYLVIHSPEDQEEADVRPPTMMVELAQEAGADKASPRWICAFSPDLHDDRMFSLWEAESADQIKSTLDRFGFLNHMDAHPIQVRRWGPADVIDAENGT